MMNAMIGEWDVTKVFGTPRKIIFPLFEIAAPRTISMASLKTRNFDLLDSTWVEAKPKPRPRLDWDQGWPLGKPENP